MKSVLASLKPYYYYLVGEGIKKIEVRKSQPKADDWDKETYFYMSKDEKSFAKIPKEFQEKYRKHFGKVGLRFVCDRITDISVSVRNCNEDYNHVYHNDECKGSCLTWKELQEYGKGKTLYGWHISNLVIYEKPKELSEFFHYCGDDPKCDGCPAHYFSNTECGKEDYCCSIIDGCKPLTRPPQSWQFVEEKE